MEVPEVAVVTEFAKEQELAIIDSVEAFPISITIPKLDKAVISAKSSVATIVDLDAAPLMA